MSRTEAGNQGSAFSAMRAANRLRDRPCRSDKGYLAPGRSQSPQACRRYPHRPGIRPWDGLPRCRPPPNRTRWRTSAFLGIVQDVGQLVVHFLAALEDAHTHHAVPVWQLISGFDDLVDRPDDAEAP